MDWEPVAPPGAIDDGTLITAELVRDVMEQERSAIRAELGDAYDDRNFETAFIAKSGVVLPVAISGSVITSVEGEERGSIGFAKDLREILHRDQLATLGEVAIGIAHEINNPLAFVTNNVAILQRDVGYLHRMLSLYQEAEGTLAVHHRELLSRIHDLGEQIDLTYVLDHLGAILIQSRDGLKRIQQIWLAKVTGALLVFGKDRLQ